MRWLMPSAQATCHRWSPKNSLSKIKISGADTRILPSLVIISYWDSIFEFLLNCGVYSIENFVGYNFLFDVFIEAL